MFIKNEDEEPTEQLLKDLEESEKSGIAFSGTGKEALEHLEEIINKEKCKHKKDYK